MPSLLRGLLAVAAGASIIFPTFSPINGILDSSLTMHMVVLHGLFIVAGFLLAYGSNMLMLTWSRFSPQVSQAYARLATLNARFNSLSILSFAAAAFLTAYWNIPVNFDAAVLNESIHLEMHATFIALGGLVMFGAKALTKTARNLAPIIAGKAF
jgi:cytochrome c oxidase assembly factor CtaG